MQVMVWLLVISTYDDSVVGAGGGLVVGAGDGSIVGADDSIISICEGLIVD